MTPSESTRTRSPGLNPGSSTSWTIATSAPLSSRTVISTPCRCVAPSSIAPPMTPPRIAPMIEPTTFAFQLPPA